MGSRIYKISKYRPSVFQGSFGFAAPGGYARRPGFSLTVEHPFERMLLRILLGALVVLIGSYVYFVSASVLNVIARKEALAQTASIASSLSTLESKYYAAAKSITPDTGEYLGLDSADSTKYVHRPGAVGIAQ